MLRAMNRSGIVGMLLLVSYLQGVEAPEYGIHMETQGYMAFIDHIHGQGKTTAPNWGYRLELLALTDLYRYNDLYLSFQVSNKTIIRGELSKGQFTLDQLIYTLRPDTRFEF